MYTAYDAVEYLMDSTGGGAQDAEHRVLRQAVFHAYRDLIGCRDWRWYETSEQIDIDRRYIVHTMPWGVQSIDSIVVNEPVGWDIMARYVEPRDFARAYNSDWNELTDLIWTVERSEFSVDRYDLKILTGYGHTPNVGTLTYRRRPRDLRFSGWEPTSRQGEVTWTGAEARGANTAFSGQMLGAVIRVSGDPVYHPEGLAGIRPYLDEGLIYQVVSADKLYAWSPNGTISYTGSKYCVTDYLDISPGMYTALLSGAEYWASRLLGKDFAAAYSVYQSDLRMAFESDAVAVLSGRRMGQCGYSWPFWYLRPGSDQGVYGPGTGGPNQDGTCPLNDDLSGGDADSEKNNEWSYSVSGGSAASQFDDCGNPK